MVLSYGDDDQLAEARWARRSRRKRKSRRKSNARSRACVLRRGNYVKSIHHAKALNKFDHNVGCPETGGYRSAVFAVASITRSVGRE